MDGIQDRKIVDVPKWTFQAFGLHMRKEYAKRNVQSGIDPVGLADIMGMDLFIPTDDTKELVAPPMILRLPSLIPLLCLMLPLRVKQSYWK